MESLTFSNVAKIKRPLLEHILEISKWGGGSDPSIVPHPPIILIVERWLKRARCRILQRGCVMCNVHEAFYFKHRRLHDRKRYAIGLVGSVHKVPRTHVYWRCTMFGLERTLQRITMRRQTPSNARQSTLGVPPLVVKRLRLLLVWSSLHHRRHNIAFGGAVFVSHADKRHSDRYDGRPRCHCRNTLTTIDQNIFTDINR